MVVKFCNIIFLMCCSNIYSQAFDSSNQIFKYYQTNKGNNLESISTGSVAKGTLINGKLLPFKGKNFQYFDTNSYLSGRAFVSNNVLKTLLYSYAELDSVEIKQKFYVMETSHKNGGDLFPHKTHQNGLSVDFMMPLLKDGQPYNGLDSIGTLHYFITFNSKGQYNKDTTICIDLNLVAQQILSLQRAANLNKLRIVKVIINTNLKDELLKTEYGKILKGSGIYLVKSLDNYTNNFHDDHFHIDFELLK